MFNVLPENFKNAIRSSYAKRRLIVWLYAFVTLQISFLIVLTPSYVSLFYQEKNLQAQNVRFTESQNADTSATAEIFQKANRELTVLSSNLSTSTASAVFTRLISLKGQAISFTQMTYQSRTASSSSLTVRGVAGSREALLSLAKRLEADPSFEQVDLPISNFAKDKNITFSMIMITH